MKKILIPLIFVSIFLALYEQSKAQPNVYVMIGAVAVFMFCMMRLSAKIPSKNQDKDDDDVQ
ncbi:hypothetical protein [Flavobacterium pallidum]|uniref:Uncharacterized protein n=1 Tax=Flavobacterium pallidum TaxID=2172098 RepID=A0A2S1SJH6_9FLAO|nr:hypothetical protein [Flavobacterium pallidum]AWI26573.1 hypothetical protein HYN49_12080 [Flavobacterium pallidum]